MSSKFKQLLDAANDRPVEPEAEEVTEPVVKEVSSKKKSRAAGKRSHPDYEQVSAYIRKETHRAVKLALLEDGGEDFSDLVEKQLQQWLKRRAKNRTTGVNDG